MNIDNTTKDGLAALAAYYGSDTEAVMHRLVNEALNEIQDPNGRITEYSPLRHGDDTAMLSSALLREAGGDRREALRLLRAEVRRRYPSFSADKPDSLGFKLWDRCRHWLYNHA